MLSKFIAIKDQETIQQDEKPFKKGDVFDSFHGLVSGVNGVRFDNKEYFKLKRHKSEKIAQWCEENLDLIKKAVQSQRYTYASKEGHAGRWMSDEMKELFKKIKTDKVYSPKTSNIDIWTKLVSYGK